MRRVADERGVTIVEAMVAGLLVVIGGLATLQVFDAATRNNFRTEESQVVVNRLQAELEEIKSLPFQEIALDTNPGSSGNENDPRSRVSGAAFALSRDGSNQRPMVIAGDGGVPAAPEPFTVGDISGKIHKFVTWAPDPSCPTCEDLKRVVVAATIDQAAVSYERTFQEVQGDVVNPDAVPADNVNPPPDGEEDAEAIFWLTDTPCTFSERQPITADHAAHNTRARCADGAQTGSTRGAPDIMFTEAPDLDPNFPPGGQPLFDYATDSEPSNPIEPDKGLLVPWSSNTDCLLDPVIDTLDIRRLLDGSLGLLQLPSTPNALDGLLDVVTGDSNKHLRSHTWLSPTVNSSGGVLTGEGTLELWTKTVNGAIHPGEICVSLFVRQRIEVPIQICVIICLPPDEIELEVDIPVVNVGSLLELENLLDPQLTYFRYSQDPWPSQWTEISMPLDFVAIDSTGVPIPFVLTPGSQVGMTLMVRRSGTQPGNALEFMYDHPSFESRLHLDTNRVISWGT